MTSHVTKTAIPCAPKPRRRSFPGFLRQLRATSSQRQRLQQLDDAALRDIGITCNQAHAEAKRPFWDAPATWHR